MTALLSTREVAERLGVSPSTVRAMVRSGQLPSIQVRRSRRVSAALLEQWLQTPTPQAGRERVRALPRAAAPAATGELTYAQRMLRRVP